MQSITVRPKDGPAYQVSEPQEVHMSEVVGRHLQQNEAIASADRMSEFWNEEYRVYREANVFLVERGWPKRSKPLYVAGPVQVNP